MKFWADSSSEVFLNPRWPDDARKKIEASVRAWLEEEAQESLLVVPTSGTTAKDISSTKLVVIKKENFLKSAEIVGKYFGFSKQDRVLQSLPLFHVGGLAQQARAHLWNQTLVPFASPRWDANEFLRFLKKEKITHVSLVPTQLYDLVQTGELAPDHLSCIFLGGANLGPALREKATHLGWKLESTFGMTETSSMIAVERQGLFDPFPEVLIKGSSDDRLCVKSPGLFWGYLQNKDDRLQFWSPLEEGFFKTEDLVRFSGDGFELLGRAMDFGKVSGEGVYLSRLSVVLQDCLIESGRPLHSMYLGFKTSDRRGQEVHAYSALGQPEAQDIIALFNQKVLPFERIQGLHQVNEVSVTELGKVRRELK